MRNITIERMKSGVASLGTYRVYIEDPSSPQLRITDVPCRQIGELKNGETATFAVGNGEARLFVIAGNSSRNYCVDMVRIPAGTEDLRFSGKAKFDLFTGNAFRFDNNDTDEVRALHKKAKGKGAVAFLIPVVLAFAIAFAASYYLFSRR
jgi:hypothetical protein